MYIFKNKVLISIITMIVIVFGCFFVSKSDSKVLAEETNKISEDKLSALSVKCQVKKNTDGSADLRLVSTVDALELYGTAGFDIYVEKDGATELLERYEKPYVTDKIGAKEDGVSFEYNPKVFDTISNYFITVTITGIPASDFAHGFLIIPFVTESGNTQRLYGVSRYVKVNDAIQGNEYLSVPVAMTFSTAYVLYDIVVAIADVVFKGGLTDVENQRKAAKEAEELAAQAAEAAIRAQARYEAEVTVRQLEAEIKEKNSIIHNLSAECEKLKTKLSKLRDYLQERNILDNSLQWIGFKGQKQEQNYDDRELEARKRATDSPVGGFNLSIRLWDM